MEVQLVHRPRVETAYPDGDFRRSEDEDDEDDEMVDDTVRNSQDHTNCQCTDEGNRDTGQSKMPSYSASISVIPCYRSLLRRMTRK
jgi:hypothetical protein